VVYLVSNAGTHFDPVLTKLFVEMIGLYPPGTLVLLSTGDTAVVCEPPVVGRPLDRPTVRLLTEEHAGQIIDLDDGADNAEAISISLVLNPANQGQVPAIDLSMFETLG
jgi:hypothetical protein